MKRILILGISGSGKTTMANRLHTFYKYPIHHLDLYFWQPGWEFPDAEQWLTKLREISSEDCWIIEGNYQSSLSILVPRADTIVFLQVSRLTAVFRVFKRMITHLKKRRVDLPLGCKEKFDLKFLLYIFRFNTDRKPILLDTIHTNGTHAKFFNLSNSRDIEEFFYSHTR